MNRKKFLSSVFSLGSVSVLPAWSSAAIDEESPAAIVPKYLKEGDLIGITCPAGFITPEEIQPAIRTMTDWGFRIKIGATVGARDFGYGGTDEQRLADFQQMLDDPSVKAIMCARGGYGSVRIVDGIDFTKFKQHPKWIIGFSDITVLHSHINRNFGIATIHSKMCNSFPEEGESTEPDQVGSILSIKDTLRGVKMHYTAPYMDRNKLGKGTGALVGGNLKTIESLSASSSDLRTTNKILFVEDTGEYLYSIDRMFWNLKRSGKLEHLQGLIIGGFKVKPDDEGEDFGQTVHDIVLDKVKKYNFPVCFDFPVGHQKANYALKCGIRHTLSVKPDGSLLIQA